MEQLVGQHRLQKHVEVIDHHALLLTRCADNSLKIALLASDFDLIIEDDN